MPQQLQMTWPRGRSVPEGTIPDGYILRNFHEGDDDAYTALMHSAFDIWPAGELAEAKKVPDGIFLIEHAATGTLAATACVQAKGVDTFPDGAALGWVAGDPGHAGKGLGSAASRAVVRRLLELGYEEIYLLTDDFRLPAIKTYLKMGFVPVHHDDDMPGRWAEVFRRLNLEEDQYPPVSPGSLG